MKMKMFNNFEFGPAEGVSLSHLGIAIENEAGNYVSYDATKDEIVDVDMIAGCANMVFAMPCTLKDVKKGDVIRHANGHPVFVKEVKDNHIYVIDIAEQEVKEILPTKSIFDFNFVTKFVSILDMFNGSASADSQFGNFLPFLMLNKKKGMDMSKILMMSALMNKKDGENSGSFDLNNPLVLMALAGDEDEEGGSESKDFFMKMAMFQQMKK